MNNINYMSKIFKNTIENSSSITYNIGVDGREKVKQKEKGRLQPSLFAFTRNYF